MLRRKVFWSKVSANVLIWSLEKSLDEKFCMALWTDSTVCSVKKSPVLPAIT